MWVGEELGTFWIGLAWIGSDLDLEWEWEWGDGGFYDDDDTIYLSTFTLLFRIFFPSLSICLVLVPSFFFLLFSFHDSFIFFLIVL